MIIGYAFDTDDGSYQEIIAFFQSILKCWFYFIKAKGSTLNLKNLVIRNLYFIYGYINIMYTIAYITTYLVALYIYMLYVVLYYISLDGCYYKH